MTIPSVALAVAVACAASALVLLPAPAAATAISAQPSAAVLAPTATVVRPLAKVGTRTRILNGTNIPRSTNMLVRYRRTGTQVYAPTSVWGVDVVVRNGRVAVIRDRQTTHAGRTAIPVDGWVLSAHGTSRTWLLANARVGRSASVVLGSVTTAPPTGTVTSSGTQLSGASGDGATNGRLAAWRGTPVRIGGTWNDSYEAQTEQWSVQPGSEWGSWNGDLDVAVGAIYQSKGQTWARAAAGAYDSRWSTALTRLKTGWGSRTGTLHIRFAHEFNGDWVPWKVTGADSANFIAAWRRFHTLQERILPNAKLVFCPNDGSSTSLRLDWRRAFPGAAYVDEMAVDTYNQYPYVNTVAGFASKISAVDGYGAPVGIERHRQFAASRGLPLGISEWSSNSSMGDGAVYVQQFRSWLSAHRGSGAGQVPFEILFNVSSYGNGVFQLYPSTRMPKAAAAYVARF